MAHRKSQSGNSWTKVPVDLQVRILAVSTKGSLLHKWQFVEEKFWFLSNSCICSIDYSKVLHHKIMNSHQKADLLKFHHHVFIKCTDNEAVPVVKQPLKKTTKLRCLQDTTTSELLETGVDWDFH